MAILHPATSLEVSRIDLRTASDHTYAALHAFTTRINSERLPDDPPVPLAELIGRYRHIPAFVDVVKDVVWTPDDTIVAIGTVVLLRMDTNQHVAQFNIEVLPEYRRQGWARRLLARIIAVAEHEQRRLLLTETTERVPGGESFMQRLQATKGLEGHTNQLRIANLDRALLRQWQERAAERAADFELACWDGPYPEPELDAIVTLLEVTNTEPRDQLDLEDFHWTRDDVRQMEHALAAEGAERWTMYAREQATGTLVGFTEVVWRSSHPQLIEQNFTGVLPAYRNRGLGSWLKAAMLERVLAERPQIALVRTHNADSNAAMLHINRALGFEPYDVTTLWQIGVDRARHYLDGIVASV
jgi:mycothiol synthase